MTDIGVGDWVECVADSNIGGLTVGALYFVTEMDGPAGDECRCGLDINLWLRAVALPACPCLFRPLRDDSETRTVAKREPVTA